VTAKKKPTKRAPKMRPDAAETAFRVMQEATRQLPKSKSPAGRSRTRKP
jgi:hypothetical protein